MIDNGNGSFTPVWAQLEQLQRHRNDEIQESRIKRLEEMVAELRAIIGATNQSPKGTEGEDTGTRV